MSLDTEAPPRKAEAPLPARAAPESGHPSRPGLAPLPGRRNPRWIALGVIALCLGGLLSYGIYARLATETPVVVALRTVYRGAPIAAGDLGTVTLRGSSLDQSIPAAELDSLIGRRAAFDLPQGSVVSRVAVADVVLPAGGRSIVGVRLAAGRVPSTMLDPGSPLRLVALPAADDPSDKLGNTTFLGRVIQQSEGSDGMSVVLDVDVDAADAPTIAMLSAQDRIAVVRDAEQ